MKKPRKFPTLKDGLGLRWAKALESGHYQQGVGMMCKNNRYCCLGVLAKVLRLKWFQLENNIIYFYSNNPSYATYGYLPSDVSKSIGLSDDARERYVHYNDTENLPFTEIAKIVRWDYC